MKALGWWLIAVGTLRLASVWFSFFDIWALKLAVFSNTTMKQRWSEPAIKGSPPTPRDSHSCTVVGDNLFVFGGTYGTNMLNDLHILDTWMAREIEQRLEKLSLRKHLKQKCLEQNLNLVQTPVLCGYGMSADSNQPMGILNFSQLRENLSIYELSEEYNKIFNFLPVVIFLFASHSWYIWIIEIPQMYMAAYIACFLVIMHFLGLLMIWDI